MISQPLEGQKAKYMLVAMMPQKKQLVLGHLKASVHDHLCGLVEIPMYKTDGLK